MVESSWVMHMIDNFLEMIAGSLSLKEPWYVAGAEFDPEAKQVHIYVKVRSNASFVCPRCSRETVRNGYEPKERVWRHGDCMFFPTYVHCRRPRVRCPFCGTKQISAPFERKSSRFTLLFEGYAMLILADMPRAKAAEVLRCDEKSLASILSFWVNDAVNRRSLEDVKRLAVDETSRLRGHDYVTLIIDADQRRVIDVEPGKDKATISTFARKLEQHGGSREAISAVTSDMSTAFLPAIAENFPNALSVIDKFHVKQVLIKALDIVRKEEQRAAASKRELFRGRRLFMIPKNRMTEMQTSMLKSLSRRYPKTGKAYRIVATLDDFYACQTIEEAETAFERLYSWMRRCRLQPMKDAASTLSNHKQKILAYFHHRITNAICEGINSMVQAAKRKARGFNTYNGFASMIYLVAGKLQLAVQHPF